MSVSDVATAEKSAKMSAMERVIASITNEATKDVVSQQTINAAISGAVQNWLKIADEATRTKFFADIETSVSEGVAKKIERHPLRPAAATPMVAAARKEAEAQSEARKAEAAQAKKERDLQKLNELKAKYESDVAPTTAKAPKADAD